MQLHEFWAKTMPFQSVPTHGIVSGRVAQVLFDLLLSFGAKKRLADSLGIADTELRDLIGYLVSLHDIGKLEYSFQMQDDTFRDKYRTRIKEEIYTPGVRHEKTGESCLRHIWKEKGEARAACGVFSKVIGSHHQGKYGNGHFKPKSNWYLYQTQLETQMRETFFDSGEKRLPEINRKEQGVIGVLSLGLLILADWISSGKTFVNAEEWIEQENSWQRIQDLARDFLCKSGLMPVRSTWEENFCGIWPNIPESGLRPLQKEIQHFFERTESKASLILLEAPMGEGKTEAGVYAALQMAKQWGKDGFYIALPTAATANQMVVRMRDLLDMHDVETSVRLLHGMAWLDDADIYEFNSKDDRNEAINWLAPVRRGLLGQYAVGTVDQAMLAATNVKYGVLRLLGLTNKVLIIDEIHSYDAYMSEIIVRLLEWCKALEIPVVMLSATLPTAMKAKLIAPYSDKPLSDAYPLITAIDENGQTTEQIISDTGHKLKIKTRCLCFLNDIDKIAKSAVKAVEDGGCLCVMMNTVKEAQKVYTSIKNMYDGDLLLFHAQFPAEQRAGIEKVCIQRYGKDKSHRPKRSILVATQVVEQSLDVDFDGMITAVAPIDLLIQRAGRIFRHSDTPRPTGCSGAVLSVLIPQTGETYGASAYVYPECLLKSTTRLIEHTDMVLIPEDIARLVKEGYDPDCIPEDEILQWREHQVREQVEAGASQQYLLAQPEKVFPTIDNGFIYDDDTDSQFLSAKTRLGEPTVRVALLSETDLAQIAPDIHTVNGFKVASVRSQRRAKIVIQRSVSIPCRRLEKQNSNLWYIKGDGLISGVRIYPAENGVCRLGNGKTLRFDTELGLLIEDSE